MHEKILALAERFATAAIDGEEWLPALKAMAELTGSSRGQLIGIGGPRGATFNLINDFTSGDLEAFLANEHGDPNINVRVRAALHDPLFRVRSEEDYDAVGRGPGFDLYRDLCQTYGIPNGCQTKLYEQDGFFVGLAVQRTEREGRTAHEDRAKFSAIAPYVRNAVRLQVALEHQGRQLLGSTFEQMGLAVFVCRSDAKVVARTAQTEAHLSAGSLRIVDGRLSLPLAGDDRLLLDALAEQHRAAAPAVSTLVTTARPPDLPLALDISRVPAQPGRLNFASEMLVIVRSKRRWRETAPSILKTAFGLSAAEADVALRLASGSTREAIAAERSTTTETVKSQIKAIFAKLNVKREVDLANMLGAFLAE